MKPSGQSSRSDPPEIDQLLQQGDRVGAMLAHPAAKVDLEEAKAAVLDRARALEVDTVPAKPQGGLDTFRLRWTADVSDSQRLWNWSYVRAAVDFRFELEIDGQIAACSSGPGKVSVYALAASLEKDGTYDIFRRSPSDTGGNAISGVQVAHLDGVVVWSGCDETRVFDADEYHAQVTDLLQALADLHTEYPDHVFPDVE